MGFNRYIKVEVTFEKDATENKSKIMRNIQLFGNLNDAQKTRLVDIADKCPMHQILTNAIEITTELN
ncbi:OsmC family protein [Flavobacterium sp. LB2P6]|uniref:OsmC family protein n=1 Tax=Flavobacterium sp. LB2P6 TaxID=3401714 RepID=UPI003AAE0722